MYQLSEKISACISYATETCGLGTVYSTQISGIYYFVLNCSKRNTEGNRRIFTGVRLVCGTLVVHFSGSVVHAFSCTTIQLNIMYHS